MIGAIATGVAGILAGAAGFIRDHWRAYLAVWGLAVVAVALAWSSDGALLTRLQAAGAGSENLAMWLSTAGRFENSSVVLALVLAIVALLGGGSRWRSAAVACLLAGIVGGLAVNVLRPTFGRARPHAAIAPGLHWFETEADHQSLPSGHATSNMASASAVLMVVPAVGVPAVVAAVAIGWSRLQLDRHYPTDVALGLLLGASIGVPIGVATAATAGRSRSTSIARS